MKLKKLALIIASIGLSCTLFAGNSFAATSTWAACTPTQVGHQDGFVRIKIESCNVNITNNLNYMTLASAGEDQMMATVLTAISLGQAVAVGTDGTSKNGYKVATAVYLSK
jgi:hypothetical protein